jgi:hypothetical protein
MIRLLLNGCWVKVGCFARAVPGFWPVGVMGGFGCFGPWVVGGCGCGPAGDAVGPVGAPMCCCQWVCWCGVRTWLWSLGQALRDRAGGAGVRRVAAGCGRPVETVRGWLRRFGARIVAVGMVFARLLRVLADDPVIPASTGDLWADTLVVIMAGFQAARKRLPGLRVGVWDWVCGVSSGCLLHPGWPPVSINTS